MKLSDLRPSEGAVKKRKRVGRGDGSGHGKTSCRGHKGQGSRSGGGTRPGFEGGQMPLQRRLPKRGFHNPFKVTAAVVNLDHLEQFPAGTEITPQLLAEHGLTAARETRVKVLADGSLTKSIVVKVHGVSARAKEKIEACGGRVELISLHD